MAQEPKSNEAVEAVHNHAAVQLEDGSAPEDVEALLVQEGLDREEARVVATRLQDARFESLLEAGRTNMRHGALWCVGGILVTAVTYSMASGGGTYVVAWGAIIFGAIRFFKGVGQVSSVRGWASVLGEATPVRESTPPISEELGEPAQTTPPPEVSSLPIGDAPTDYRWIWWLVGVVVLTFVAYVIMQIVAGKVPW